MTDGYRWKMKDYGIFYSKKRVLKEDRRGESTTDLKRHSMEKEVK